ncbi:uncharacterized protein PG998_002688 [Apiospora kogelbergensis]
MVERLLRSPSFHAGVRRVHRVLDERQNGPHPGGEEPLRPGEATEEQGVQPRRAGFVKYFVEEIGNQARGRPTDEAAIDDPPPPPPTSRQQQQQQSTWTRKRS